MSKINKIRFVNLNYNNNTMKIDDESFFLDSENTMFNLRNGGGKSVLVQMMMAPFVNKRYRDFKDRAFESYFTSAIPTYILVEWKLEDEAGFLLTGMMVRKSESTSDENSKEKLDIINFIHEYKNKNEYDIDNLKIVDENNNTRVVKSYANSKKLFEELKKRSDIKFNYYDMTNSATTSAYFSTLSHYKINNKEWENVIKKINLKESGLSELFANAKNSEGLVKEWFLPAIENKLKKDEDRIKNYRELLISYIKQYKENKHNIDKKEKIELFNELSEEVFLKLEELLGIIENSGQLENEIANVISFLKESIKENIIEEEELDNTIEKLQALINELKYENKSLQIYNKEKECEEYKENLNKLNAALEKSAKEIVELKRRRNILACSKLHKEYKKVSEELQKYESKFRLLQNTNEDYTSHLNDLGYSIKNILSYELNNAEKEEKDKLSIRKCLKEEEMSLNNILKESRKKIAENNRKQGMLENSIESFSKDEEKFNNEYNENLFRNISGFLDEEALLNLDKNIKEEKVHLYEERKNSNENLIKEEENIKRKNREKEITSRKYIDIENDLKYKNEDYNKYNEEIEKRIEIIKYVDLDAEKVFDSLEIISLFERKINSIKDDLRNLQRIYDKKYAEIEKLQSGKILELSKEVEDFLKKKDINIVYGAEWLKKNNFSNTKNEEFIRRNPFIPYSLIMESEEIETLEKESLDIFTSFPISIINREDLEKNMNENNLSLIDLNGIRFFISFNNKLLNEIELLKLINDKKLELEKIEKEIKDKNEDIEFYRIKENCIKNSSLTYESYNNLKNEIEQLSKEKDQLKLLEIKLEKELQEIRDVIENTKLKIINIDKSIDSNKRKSNDFNNLKYVYGVYKENKEKLEKLIELTQITNSVIRKNEDRVSEISKELYECEEKIRFYRNTYDEIRKQIAEYDIYKTGLIIEKDKEDLVAEYKAINSKISDSEQELKDKIQEATEKFKEIEEELISKVKNYNLEEKEYTSVDYDRNKEFEVEEFLNKEEKNFNSLKDIISDINKKLAVSTDNLDRYYKELKREFEKDIPKKKELIFQKNYNEEEAKLKLELEDNKKKKMNLLNLKNILNSNLNNLNEYSDLNIVNYVQLNIDINELETYIGKLRRDLRNTKEKENKKINSLGMVLFNIKARDEFKDEHFFKEPIETLLTLVSKPQELLEQLNMLKDSYNKLIEKLIYDIGLIEREEENILESLLEYINDIHENIAQIDNNSSILINEKRVKMLNISVSDWQENKEIYKIKLKDHIEQLRNVCIETLEKNESIEEIVSNKINVTKLYDEVVSLSSINIKLYKIEEDKQRLISWNEVSTNSGGEGFLSAFVILSSLLSYMRKNENDIFSRREEGKVLIMDNPFAQTSSAHLLKPLIDIAKKSNTQLICLTGLGGDSIYNRFDNIYVLKLIPSKIKSGIKYLKSEHSRGEEEENEVIVSSRFKIEEQTRLF